MKGDFGRQTFKRENHYAAVLMQQGRVQLDADWNEQQAITRHLDEAQGADVIGPSGAPQTAPGFEIVPQGADLRIGGGHFYVDGILCENETDVLFTRQPDLLDTGTGLLPATDGLYLAYLEVWQRHVTALEDESIRETALGGPDTATRTQTVWQVRLLPVADPGGTVTCGTAFPEWTQLLQRNLTGTVAVGRMSARSQPEEPSPDPLCILPPGAGYRGLENQLYRVEVHRGGDRTQATFKWSRDNGTVASAIEADENGVVVQGTLVEVAEIGKDGMLTFASDPLPEWVELTDDRLDLLDQRGQLARVQSVDPATRTITFAPGTLPVLDAAQHPLVRRWDQTGSGATAEGVAMTGDWQKLEDGVEVRFDPGTYRQGDFWTIPARTAIGSETGTIEWPHVGTSPVAQAPHGTRHHFARLAVVRRSGGAFALVPDGDCRALFPPLTAIAATDVSFSDAACAFGNVTNVQEALDTLCRRGTSMCSVLVGPGEDLHAALSRLAGVQDALICLKPGTYQLAQPLEIRDRRHIQLVGAGPATRVVAPGSETALRFVNCESVNVSDVYVESGVVGRAAATRDLNGAVSFLDCRSVTVADATVRCPGGPLRAAACVVVRNVDANPSARADVRDSQLQVGHMQTAVLLVNVARSRVVDNSIGAASRPADAVLLEDVDYRGAARRHMVSQVTGGGAPPPGTNATLTFANAVVHFRTDPALIRSGRNDTEWQRALNALKPTGIGSAKQLERWLLRLAGELVRTRGAAVSGSPAFANVVNSILAQDTAAAGQGVVVGGDRADDVRISGNTIRDAVQGIHVGLGTGAATTSAGVVVIADNVLRVSLPATATRERHAVFVGHCDSLVVERNYSGIVRAPRNASLPVEGIRIFGTIGRRAIVRHNHLGAQFNTGVTFAPLNPTLAAKPLWLVTENEMESATTKVDVPAARPGSAGVPDPAAVRARILGIDQNFA